MSNNDIIVDIQLHDFDAKGNCLADIMLQHSGTVISDLKVMNGPGGSIMVHMPTWMHSSWAYPEIAWSEVRKAVTTKYKSTEIQDLIPHIHLHHYDSIGNCLADITLPESGIQVTGLKVMQGPGGGIMVHMPSWMHTRWSYPEIQWATVRQIVTEKYKETASACTSNIHVVQRQDIKTSAAPRFRFYSKQILIDTSITIQPNESNEQIPGFHLVSDCNGKEWVYMPSSMSANWSRTDITWDDVRKQILYAFQERGNTNLSRWEGPTLNILFGESQTIESYLVDAELPHKRNIIKGFRLKKTDTIRVSPPSWMGRWNDSVYSWSMICNLISNSFEVFSAQNCAPSTSPETGDNLPKQIKNGNQREVDKETAPKEKVVREKNEYGRIKNAENSSLKYYPHTVLRLSDKDSDSQPKKKMFDLVTALSKGSQGGIGPFEINILNWVDRLKYVSSTMLLDLIRGGYVATGWREDITQSKLAKILSRMSQFDLVTLTRFVTIDDNGIPVSEAHSIMRILTLGKTGSVLLHELGQNTTRYNAFNIFQDGNTVKRYLAANQWLIYWLTTFPTAISENYETSTVIYQKGSDFSGARIFAAVTCNDCTLVAEPLRRVEAFEGESNKNWLRQKYLRFLNLFSHLDELYAGQEEISFATRPVLVYLCEDDTHIEEVWDVLSDMIVTHSEQEVWFTTDLRIFNYNKKGERFLRLDLEGKHIVDISERMGVSE